MEIRKLQLRNYRNYKNLDLELSKNINVFLGRNAQGKTNIIESIYYGALGRSHRTHTDNDLISWQEKNAAIKIAFSRLDVLNQLEIQFSTEKRRRIILNSHATRLKECIGSLNAVLFSPEDLFLIKGAPNLRRRFLDSEISQASPAYYHELTKYNRIIVQRNNLLKKIREHKADKTMLALWDSQLAVSAATITTKRQLAVKKLNMLANLMQRRISDNQENLSVSYSISQSEVNMTNDLASWYNEMLINSQAQDILRGSTSVGPHHDDLIFSVNGINLRSFGSQGQQRTGVLAIKLAELEFLRSETGEYPVLLLDDVMSELDAVRREKLLDFIRKEKIQTMITATDKAYFPDKEFGKFYYVDNGIVTE